MHLRQFVLVCVVSVITCIMIQTAGAILINGNETDDGTYFYNLGARLLAGGEFERAISAFDNALASDTTMIQRSDALSYLYSDKAFALIQLGRFNEAVDTADQGLSLYPHDVSLWNNKGYALFRLRQYNDAVHAYDQALGIEKDTTKLSKYWTNKGEALFSAGKYQEAADAFDKGLELNPSNTDAADGISRAQQKASEGSLMMIGAVIAIVAGAGTVAYFLHRKKSKGTPPETKEQKKR
jgi:tetratricopeptide (TPR) repeat protein